MWINFISQVRQTGRVLENEYIVWFPPHELQGAVDTDTVKIPRTYVFDQNSITVIVICCVMAQFPRVSCGSVTEHLNY